jgi:hypothetical protein
MDIPLVGSPSTLSCHPCDLIEIVDLQSWLKSRPPDIANLGIDIPIGVLTHCDPTMDGPPCELVCM